MQQERAQALAPPPGFRPAIPVQVKFEAVMRTEGRCEKCGGKLGSWKTSQFDHRPPIQARCWDPDAQDTIPSANDPEFVEASHKDCHLVCTTGRRGESRLSKRGGDVSEIAKTKRLTAEEADFRRRMLAKGDVAEEVGEGVTAPIGSKAKRKIPSRPFPKKPKKPKLDRHLRNI